MYVRTCSVLQADSILASRCIGIVGSFDHDSTNLMLQVACGRSERGLCPPSRDLSNCQKKQQQIAAAEEKSKERTFY
jgi:hypothetical protein